MGKYRQLALRLALYIEALGGELTSLEGTDFKVHVARLERQYIDLRHALDPEVVRSARAAARVKIQTQGLLNAAGGLIPFQSPAPKQSEEHLPAHQKVVPEKAADESLTGSERTRRSRWKTKQAKLEAFFATPGQTVLKCPKCRMRCGFHKKSYPTRDLAENAKKRSRGGRDLVAYECYCQPGYWHLGHARRKG